jgi:serine protease
MSGMGGMGRGFKRLAGAVCLALAGCGGGGSGTTTQDTEADLPGPGVRLAGTLSLPAGATVDSDLNDVHQLGRTRNNDLASAQALTAPVLLVGSVNRPGTGPAGHHQADGDATDAYVLDLQAGDLVELEFAPGATDAAHPPDLDLYVVSHDGALTGSSDGSDGRYECVRITQTARYYLKVDAFQQASAYTLRAGPAATPTTGCTATASRASFDAGELVAQLRTPAPGLATALSSRATGAPRGPYLITVATGATSATSASPPQRQTAQSQRATSSPAHLPDTRLETLRQAKTLRATGDYDFVEPNWRLDTATTLGSFPPDDLHYGEQRWHHALIELPAAIGRLQALPVQPAQRPIIAVIDTGVMLDHPDLQPQLASLGRAFVTDRVPGDRNQANGDDQRLAEDNAISHGTHVAGTAAAATFNGIGVAGVAPMARLMPLNVVGRNGSAKTIDILQAMRYAAGLDNSAGVLPARRADIINLSMGTPGACSVAFQDTIRRVRAAGTLVVVAAGSKADNASGQSTEVQQPANCAGAIAVGAVRSDRQRSPYANSGATLTVTAPGGDLDPASLARGDSAGIFSTLVNFTGDGQRVAGVGPQQGSSMAAPQVSGVLALMRYLDPELSPESVDALFASGQLTDDLGEPGRDHHHGWGLINARKAVEAVLVPQAGADSVVSGSATLGIRPARLDLGNLRSTATLDLVVTAGRRATVTDAVVAVRSDSPALTLQVTAADPSISLHRQTVTLDRRLLPADGLHAVTVTFTLRSGAELAVPVTLERPAGSAESGPGWGPAYVTLHDPDTGRLLHTVIAHAAQGRYRWQLDGYRRARVQVRASGDPNNDGQHCRPGKPCGHHGPADAARTVSLTGDRTDLDLALSLAPWAGSTLP